MGELEASLRLLDQQLNGFDVYLTALSSPQ
jgi:hypothetical protein